MNHEYVGIYDDGTGGIWFLISGPSLAEVQARFPSLHVVERHDAPGSAGVDFDRLRMFVADGEDPVAPVADRSDDEIAAFLTRRERVHAEIAAARRQLPAAVRDRMPASAPVRWVRWGRDEQLVQELQRLGPPPSRSSRETPS